MLVGDLEDGMSEQMKAQQVSVSLPAELRAHSSAQSALLVAPATLSPPTITGDQQASR
jgi:hypothetical protein